MEYTPHQLGLHGVGVSVVNALSDHLKVEVFKKKKIHFHFYLSPHALKKSKKTVTCPHGTRVTFLPDDKYLEKI